MKLSELSLDLIHILPPVSKNDLYEFPLTYKSDDEDKEIIFESLHAYGLRSSGMEADSCGLHIKERSELKFFNDLYKHLNESMFQMHADYFESSFERKEYNKLFKHYLFPNIEENAVNIHCVIDPSMIEPYVGKEDVSIIPRFHLKSIVFDQPSFYISLELKDILPLENEAEVKQEAAVEPEVKEEALEPEVKQTTEPAVEKTDLEEVYINKSDNMEQVSLNLNDEDYFILFKIIQSNIKENVSESLLKIFNSKQIETKNINIQDIVYDSENEDSDEEDEYLEKDDFEREYKRMV
tara:strand:+ start:313 stop:1197 length:885 start_codon:yes stop_codon:yes gene_type:complete